MSASIAYDRARAGYEAHARRHPAKAARLLSKFEAQGVGSDHSQDRLRGMVDGLRAGLDGDVRCRRCGRRLEDPESKARKIGPDCVRKVAAA